MQEKISAQYKNEIEMAKAQRDYELKKAAYDMEVNTKKAESEMAYQLQVHNSNNIDGEHQGREYVFFSWQGAGSNSFPIINKSRISQIIIVKPEDYFT